MWPIFLFRRKCHCEINELVRSLWTLTFLLQCPDVDVKVVWNISNLESHKDNGELYVVNLMTVRNFLLVNIGTSKQQCVKCICHQWNLPFFHKDAIFNPCHNFVSRLGKPPLKVMCEHLHLDNDQLWNYCIDIWWMKSIKTLLLVHAVNKCTISYTKTCLNHPAIYFQIRTLLHDGKVLHVRPKIQTNQFATILRLFDIKRMWQQSIYHRNDGGKRHQVTRQ